MSVESREKRNERIRAWRAKNRDIYLLSRREYYHAHSQHILTLYKRAYQFKKDKANERRRADRRQNPEKYRKEDKDRYLNNKQKILDKNRRTFERNRVKYLARKRQYNAEHIEETRLWRKLNLDHLIDYNRRKRGEAKPYQFARKDSCEFCGMTNKESQVKYRSRLDIHHIDNDLKNNSQENLMTLCRPCHAKYKIAIPVIE